MIKKGGPSAAVAILVKQVGKINALAKLQEQRARAHNKASFSIAETIRKDAKMAATKAKQARLAEVKVKRVKARADEASSGWHDAQDAVKSAEKGLAAMLRMGTTVTTKTMSPEKRRPLTAVATQTGMKATTKAVAAKPSTRTKMRDRKVSVKSAVVQTKQKEQQAQAVLSTPEHTKEKKIRLTKKKTVGRHAAKKNTKAADKARALLRPKDVEGSIKEAYRIIGTPLVSTHAGDVPMNVDPEDAAAEAEPLNQQDDETYDDLGNFDSSDYLDGEDFDFVISDEVY